MELTNYQKAKRWLHDLYLSLMAKNKKLFIELLAKRDLYFKFIMHDESTQMKFFNLCATGIKVFNL